MAHVSSSTEGYYVMADDYTGTKDDFLAGPFASQRDAETACKHRNLVTIAGKPAAEHAYAILTGQCDSWSDALERIKREVLEPSAFSGDVDSKLAWLELDRIICLMREAQEIFNRVYPGTTV